MARGEEAAIFDGLKADAEHSMPSIAQVLSKFTGKTASTAESSLDAHVLNESNITGDLGKITDKPSVPEPHATTAPTGKTTEILKGLTKDDDAAAAFKPKDEPADAVPKDPAGSTPEPKGGADYSGNPNFRSSDADRAKFKSEYSDYADDEAFVKDLQSKRPDLQGIPAEDLVAVRGYTGDEYYSQMNKALRTGDTAGLQTYDPHIRGTTSGLNQLPKTTGEFYRGMNIPAGNVGDVLAKYEPGKVVTEPHFLSTGNPFGGNIQYVVQSSTGRDVSFLSHYPHESEVLFPPGSNFRVDSKIETSPGNWEIKMTDVG
jgi:NAD:arginine ADP-ribosyltransferase